MSRRVVWLQILIGWLPVWALFATLIHTAHDDTSWITASLISLRMIVAGAALGVIVHRLTDRMPWPGVVRPLFVLHHVMAAMAYSLAWVVLNGLIDGVFRGGYVSVFGYAIGGYLMLGVWLYVMIAGVSYSATATERAARAEANAARAQLAALRAQLNPHFLFNALHAVVQLIPREPKRAAQAAEQLAGLLRGTIEEDRDVVTLGEEWAFVERYLELERLRFGDRLRVHVEITDEARAASIPLFAVQTLVENAVRHGAAPRVDPTDVTVRASVSGGRLAVSVEDTGAGATGPQRDGTSGTGLWRLRERLAVLHGTDASLLIESREGEGFRAVLSVPAAAGA